jgi:general secretion pathway protein D
MIRTLATVAILLCLLSGCAGERAFREGKGLVAAGNIEAGLEKLKQAISEEPTNGEFRQSYLQTREIVVNRWIDEIDHARISGDMVHVKHLLGRILALDPNNARAKSIQVEIQRESWEKEKLTQAQTALSTHDIEKSNALLREVLAENPQNSVALSLSKTIRETHYAQNGDAQAHPGLRSPISLEFNEAPLRQVFEVLSKVAGVNFIFDKDIRPDLRVTVFLRNTTIDEALNLILLTNQLEKRVLDQSSFLIFPNTPPKTRDYQELAVKTFFLSNADVKNVGNTIKTIVKTRDMVIDEQQNMLILRDTPEALRLAEKLVALHDLAQPEVMLEIEILEVTRSKLMSLGVQWPGQLSLSPLASGSTLTLADLKNASNSTLGATIDPLVINAKKTDGFTNILANPRIRIRARETAKVMIGERLPNITTTLTSTGFSSENIQYIDVGLKLEAQPFIYPDNEIVIKLALEVSSVGTQTTTKSGSSAYQIGTRTASTVLRLKDGENQILAGLINDEDRTSATKLPGLGDIPILGRLFGSQTDNGKKTEIVLSITPRLIRTMPRPSLQESEFASGTESNFKVRHINRAASVQKTPISVPASGDTGAKVSAIPAKVDAEESGSVDPSNSLSQTLLQWKGASQVKVGESFSLTLSVTPDQAISTIPYSIAYDPLVLEVASIQAGTFLKQGSIETSYSSHVDQEKGVVSAIESRPGNSGASETGDLVTINFRALKTAGNTQIKVTNLNPVATIGAPVTTSPLPIQTISISK